MMHSQCEFTAAELEVMQLFGPQPSSYQSKKKSLQTGDCTRVDLKLTKQVKRIHLNKELLYTLLVVKRFASGLTRAHCVSVRYQ